MIAISARDFALIEAALNEIPYLSDTRTKAQEAIAKVREFIAPPELLDEAREIALRVEDEEDRISFDDDASTSPSDQGTFVSCWFWVPNPPAEEDGE